MLMFQASFLLFNNGSGPGQLTLRERLWHNQTRNDHFQYDLCKDPLHDLAVDIG